MPPKPLQYPSTRKSDLVEDYHGTPVADPYRWLEEVDSPETKQWTAEQNRLTRDYLDRFPELETIKTRLNELWNYPKYETIFKKGKRTFYTKNDGLQNQAVLFVQDEPGTEARVLIDPNTLSEDGTIALMSQHYSKDGDFLAFCLASSGSDWQEIHILDVETGAKFEEIIQWTKSPYIAWRPDKSGFYYNRLPEPGSVPTEDQNNYVKIYYHRLGSPQSEDILVHQQPDDKELRSYPTSTEDDAYLILITARGTSRKNGIYYRPMDSNEDFICLLEDGEAKFMPAGNRGSVIYFLTNHDVPLGRVIAIDLDNPGRENWVEVIPEAEDALANVKIINGHLVVFSNHHAHNQIKIYSLEGQYIQDVPLPTMGTATLVDSGENRLEFFFSFTSFLHPTTIMKYDFASAELTPFRESQLDFDIDAYETRQIFFPSKDGTQVPMFLTHKKGIDLDGGNPTILYGYGGFTLSLTPFFEVWNLVWLEMGGVFAVANLRGGDEYGEDWHRAGMLESKQNVFDDFITAAEWLIENKYTRRGKLAIEGRSNGGLLVSACMLQRPDLYGAVLCHVPVTDMLRFHNFTLGRFWTVEYGNAEENPEHFKFLYAYSPLHNVEAGVNYPPIIVTTADTDDRVVPSHSKKFVATLQEANGRGNPILLRVETKAGHKLGKPTYKIIEERADVWAFLVAALGMSK